MSGRVVGIAEEDQLRVFLFSKGNQFIHIHGFQWIHIESHNIGMITGCIVIIHPKIRGQGQKFLPFFQKHTYQKAKMLIRSVAGQYTGSRHPDPIAIGFAKQRTRIIWIAVKIYIEDCLLDLFSNRGR